MEIRVLRYFLAVARKGSITAAANYLHLTQPTLSRQLKDLEEELGQSDSYAGGHAAEKTCRGDHRHGGQDPVRICLPG